MVVAGQASTIAGGRKVQTDRCDTFLIGHSGGQGRSCTVIKAVATLASSSPTKSSVKEKLGFTPIALLNKTSAPVAPLTDITTSTSVTSVLTAESWRCSREERLLEFATSTLKERWPNEREQTLSSFSRRSILSTLQQSSHALIVTFVRSRPLLLSGTKNWKPPGTVFLSGAATTQWYFLLWELHSELTATSPLLFQKLSCLPQSAIARATKLFQPRLWSSAPPQTERWAATSTHRISNGRQYG